MSDDETYKDKIFKIAIYKINREIQERDDKMNNKITVLDCSPDGLYIHQYKGLEDFCKYFEFEESINEILQKFKLTDKKPSEFGDLDFPVYQWGESYYIFLKANPLEIVAEEVKVNYKLKEVN